jgi:tetratricopeptide (TPR) repeat protein
MELHLFDLRAIRAGLKAIGLDWDLEEYPPAPAGPPAPLQVRVAMGNILKTVEAARLVIQANRPHAAGDHAQALAALRQAVQADPGHAEAHNNLAWLLLTGPTKLRDPKEALPHARKAVEFTERAIYVNTLGLALYRSGQFAEAIPVLEKSLKEGKGQTDAFDLFFLAMCHHRLGRAARARDCYDRAARWLQAHRGKLPARWGAELRDFQAEADDVLARPAAEKLEERSTIKHRS